MMMMMMMMTTTKMAVEAIHSSVHSTKILSMSFDSVMPQYCLKDDVECVGTSRGQSRYEVSTRGF